MKRALLALLLPLQALAQTALPPAPRALSDASAAGDPQAAAFAIERGADPNALGEDGLTPLMRAAQARSFETVRTLLWNGAHAGLSNPSGKTALDFLPSPTYENSADNTEDLSRYLLQILLRGYVLFERHGERAPLTQPVTRPGLILLDSLAVDYRSPKLASSIYVNAAEAGGVRGKDDDENGFVDDVFGWRGQPPGPWENDPNYGSIFTEQKDAAARLLRAYSAAQTGGATEQAALQRLEIELATGKTGAPSLDAVLAASRGTHLANLALEAAKGAARLHFIAVPTTVPHPPTGPLCESYLAELAHEAKSPDQFCDLLLDRVLTEQVAVGKTLSRYVRVTGAGIVLLPPPLAHRLRETVACVEEIFAARPNPTERLSPQQVHRLRWELTCYEAVPSAMMMFENPNVLFICAAGDQARDTDNSLTAPAGLSRFFPNALTVTSVGATDRLSTFANRGRYSVQIAAPGEKATAPAPGGNTLTASSTSVAAARVAGVAAALRTAAPRIEAGELREIFLESATSSPNQPLILNAGRANEFLPGNTPAALRARAARLRTQGQYLAAAAAITAALDVEKNAASWTEKAVIEHDSGDLKAGVAALGKAIDLDRKNISLLLRRAAWWTELGDFGGFSHDSDAALALAPDDLALANSYAQALFGWKSYRRSAELFRETAARARAVGMPVPLETLAGLAISLWQNESTHAEALARFHELVAAERGYGDPEWLRAHGWSAEPLAVLQAIQAAQSTTTSGTSGARR